MCFNLSHFLASKNCLQNPSRQAALYWRQVGNIWSGAMSKFWILHACACDRWPGSYTVMAQIYRFFSANVSIRGYFNNANAPSTRGKLILCIRKMIRHGCQLLSVCMVARSRPSSCSLHDCWCEGLSSNFSFVKKDDTFGNIRSLSGV